MADLGGDFGAEPRLATGSLHLTLKNLAHATGGTNQLKPKPDQTIEGTSGDDTTPTAPDPSAEKSARRVVTGLPRSQTFERKLSEQRMHLEPVSTTTEERRAASVGKRSVEMSNELGTTLADPSSDAAYGHLSPSFDDHGSNSSHYLLSERGNYHLSTRSMKPASFDSTSQYDSPQTDACSVPDTVSMTPSQHDAMIADELDRRWILNLSMHFRDRSKREKFFVTYRKEDHLWRRVTISLDYRDAPPNSLEMDLLHTRYQRDKSAKIYEAIRESLPEITFYDTVTNLKLQTTAGRLHVHVVEDGNEIINYPLVSQIRYLGCKRIREREIVFDSHMSGFVYKVHVHGQTLIKKEIPSPDTIEEFSYEVHALGSLRYSRHVVQLYGVVVDDHDERVKGLLISYAEQGALIDIIYDNCKEQNLGIAWSKRQCWARQIVQGLADIHESGFVQGDFTLSNIVVNAAGDAKIIDINRRGCPVGWEPPESTALIEANHRINMYIGVKSDLYQLGMVLWGLAMLEDEPETHGRPLMLGPEINIPDWYRHMTEICLSTDPRMRLQASSLLHMFPPDSEGHTGPPLHVDVALSLDGESACEPSTRQPHIIRTVEPSGVWPYLSKTYVDPSPERYEPYYPMRGRSPPSPLPSHLDDREFRDKSFSSTSWAANKSVRPSYSDIADDDAAIPNENIVGSALRPETPPSLGKDDVDSAAYIPADVDLEDISPRRAATPSIERKRSLGDGLRMLSTPKLSRHDTAIIAPKHDGGQNTAPSRDDQLSTAAPVVTGVISPDAIEQQFLDAQEPKTAETELDGGVSLQSGIDLSGLGTTQLSSQCTTPDLQRADEIKGKPSKKFMMPTQGMGTEQTRRDESRAYSACIEKISSAQVEKSTADSNNHLKMDSQPSESLRATGRFEATRRGQPFSRQRSLPLSLAGVGAGLQFENDAKTKGGKKMMNSKH
ncbi:hypothetical protein EsDP_00004611 [Epichloe bromicola]|uniref:Protein kinase domain-containing protein n=1 Tax=Epichloe bromicola TaxID=79588 RepID=A0ABQ0CS81_9HYPO